MNSESANGIVHLTSKRAVQDVLDHLLSLLQSKGITVFAVIDHSGEAEKAGMEMPTTKVVVFGSPKAGTPLMVAVPDVALDLPLKILLAENPDGATVIAYNSVAYLQERYNLPSELTANIAAIDHIARALAS